MEIVQKFSLPFIKHSELIQNYIWKAGHIKECRKSLEDINERIQTRRLFCVCLWHNYIPHMLLYQLMCIPGRIWRVLSIWHFSWVTHCGFSCFGSSQRGYHVLSVINKYMSFQCVPWHLSVTIVFSFWYQPTHTSLIHLLLCCYPFLGSLQRLDSPPGWESCSMTYAMSTLHNPATRPTCAQVSGEKFPLHKLARTVSQLITNWSE